VDRILTQRPSFEHLLTEGHHLPVKNQLISYDDPFELPIISATQGVVRLTLAPTDYLKEIADTDDEELENA
jgi:hypothetical protein